MMRVIVAAYNCATHIDESITSLLGQTLVPEIIVFDDASTDGTPDRIAHLDIDIVRNAVRVGALANYWAGAVQSHDDDIIVNVDGDDYLTDTEAIERIAHEFRDPDVWVVHGAYERSDGAPMTGTGQYMSGDFRNQPCRVAGLRAYRAKLAKKIRLEDLKIGGFWQTSGWDNALMLPMLEMAGLDRIRYIETPLYGYRIHDKNDRQQDKWYQEFCSWRSRKRPAYSRLNSLDDDPVFGPSTCDRALVLGSDGAFDAPDSITLGARASNIPSVMIATPAYGGQVTTSYLVSLVQTLETFVKLGIRHELHTIGTESLVPRARNILAHNFMRTGLHKLLFIDADIGWEPSSVLKLLTAKKDVVVGAYPIKGIDWKAVITAAHRGESAPERYASKVVVNHVIDRDEGSVSQAKDSLVQVADGATGFMCIDRSVIERMQVGYPERAYVDDGPRLAGAEPATIYNLFPAEVFDDHVDGNPARRYLSEDYGFCRLWQRLGGKVFLHLGVELTHTGSYTFRGSPMQLAKESRVLQFSDEDIEAARAILEGKHDPPTQPERVIDLDPVGGAMAIRLAHTHPQTKVICVERRPNRRAILEANLATARAYATVLDDMPDIRPGDYVIRRGIPA